MFLMESAVSTPDECNRGGSLKAELGAAVLLFDAVLSAPAGLAKKELMKALLWNVGCLNEQNLRDGEQVGGRGLCSA